MSAAQWDLLTEALQLERYPAPIEVRSHGPTAAERGRIRTDVSEQLRRLGLMRAGRVDADLEAAMRLLHRPASWLDSVWLAEPTADQPVRVLAARGGTVAVCALQDPDQAGATLLDVIPVAGMAAAVVSRLPPHPPGRSPAATIALASTDRPARGGGGVLVSAGPVRTSSERECAAATAILDQPHARAGQIAANMRDCGRVRRSQVLRWCDNPDGRYQITVTAHRDDARSLAVAPCDPRRLIEAVQHLVDSLDW
ncbi:MAG: ESX secretion-associated protein EspG [Pseudonocardiales bacterium]|nr:ESX secretion-associated protein EspG [Pseudonocardiales bacterium]